MPTIYLSPSTQEANIYVTGSGSEETHMNQLADAMIPYLNANAIAYRRNAPEMTASSSIRKSNDGKYDFHLALHSKCSRPENRGENRGVIASYFPESRNGKRAADLFVTHLREVYPQSDKVRSEGTRRIGEVRMTRAPSTLLELGFHDNYCDARWVETRKDAIAQELVRALTDYFGLPFIYPSGQIMGRVDLSWGTLNLRNYPSLHGRVIYSIPEGAKVVVYGRWEDWYSVRYGNKQGYVAVPYIQI